MPTAINDHRPSSATPELATPHPNAHIGGNQVMGLSSSSTAEADGIGEVVVWNARFMVSIYDDTRRDESEKCRTARTLSCRRASAEFMKMGVERGGAQSCSSSVKSIP
jgi:hypothetical protein